MIDGGTSKESSKTAGIVFDLVLILGHPMRKTSCEVGCQLND